MKAEKWIEHERLALIKEDGETIGAFLEWLLHDQGLVIARWHRTDMGHDRLTPDHRGIETLLAEYFAIDLRVLEDEKRAMLAEAGECARAKKLPD